MIQPSSAFRTPSPSVHPDTADHRGEPGPARDVPSPSDLLELLYAELRAAADRHMRHEPGDHTLQPTAVVHEAWLRLKDVESNEWQGPTHFKAVAARTMRRVLVDHARARKAERRGGDRRREPLDGTWLAEGSERVDVLALEQSLAELGRRSERQMRVIEMRFFGGLSQVETAQALGVSEETVKRDWRLARAWLHRELERGSER